MYGKLRFNSRIHGSLVPARQRSCTRHTRLSCILHGHHLPAHFASVVCKEPSREHDGHGSRNEPLIKNLFFTFHHDDDSLVIANSAKPLRTKVRFWDTREIKRGYLINVAPWVINRFSNNRTIKWERHRKDIANIIKREIVYKKKKYI